MNANVTAKQLTEYFESQIEWTKYSLSAAIDAIERASASTGDKWDVSSWAPAGLYEPYGLTIVAYIHTGEQLAAMLRALALEGVRRVKEDQPFDCADTMTRLYAMKHFDVAINFHARLVGENCKRVEVGTQPKYEIICA